MPEYSGGLTGLAGDIGGIQDVGGRLTGEIMAGNEYNRLRNKEKTEEDRMLEKEMREQSLRTVTTFLDFASRATTNEQKKDINEMAKHVDPHLKTLGLPFNADQIAKNWTPESAQEMGKYYKAIESNEVRKIEGFYKLPKEVQTNLIDMEKAYKDDKKLEEIKKEQQETKQKDIQAALAFKNQQMGNLPGRALTANDITNITMAQSGEGRKKIFEKEKENTPTELAKLQTEYAAIENKNPNDPRLKQYEAELKRRGEGLPYFTFQQTAEGITPANVRSGQLGQSSGVGKPLTGEMITTEQQISTLKDTFDRVKKSYNPSYVGYYEGRKGSLKEKTVGLNEEQASFYSNLEQVKNTLIYLLSGKQINESEYNRLTKQLPMRNLPDKVFETRMNEFERTLNSMVENRQKNMGGYGMNNKQKESDKPDFLGLR